MTLIINGITYEVIQRKTAEDHEAEGHVNMAKQMREIGAVADFYLKRQRSRGVCYFAREFKSGFRSDAPCSLGRI